MGGILSDKTDNRQRRPEYAKRQWHVERHTTVTLQEILDHVRAPPVIDYLSLDIEGAEYDALKSFDFTAYRFQALTIERPVKELRALLREKSYVFVKDNGCFGDQLWVHSSLAAQARQRLDSPFTEDSADFNLCCREELMREKGLMGATIDNGCCGAVGHSMADCIKKATGA